MDYILGIDLGTSGIRINVIDADKKLLSAGRIEQSKDTSPHQWWAACKQLIAKLPDDIRSKITGIAVDGTSSSIFLCNQNGEPTSPVLWYDNNQATAQAARIAAIAPRDCAAHGTTSGLAKLLWLMDNGFRGDLIAHQADWIRACFTQNFIRSDANNSLKMGYDPANHIWPDWLSSLDINLSLLPEVDIPGQYSETIHPDISKQLGLNNSCQIIAGTTDSIAAFIASGARNPGDAVTSLGSTLVLKLITDKPVFAPEYGIYSHRLFDYWLIGGASNTGGAVLKHYFNDQEINKYTKKINPEKPTGLNYYPLLKPGERFPVCDNAMQPAISPIPKDRIIFLQGLFEGIANIEKLGYEKLAAIGTLHPSQVFSSGRGAANTVWTEIRQGYLQTKMMEPLSSHAAYGSAMLALHYLRK